VNQHRTQQKRASHREERKQDSNPHEAAITLAVQNNFPKIAEMILREITLHDAVRNDEATLNQVKRLAK